MHSPALVAFAALLSGVLAGPVSNTPTPTTTKADTAATTTKPGRVIDTPSPAQPGMVTNCDHFHKVAKGDNCASIIAKYGLSMDEFTKWNTQVGGKECTNLWLNNHVCVSTLDHMMPVVTPSPVQSGMVDKCRQFHLIKAGDTCDSMATRYKERVEDIIKWNPAVGEKCYNLWVGFHACVHV